MKLASFTFAVLVTASGCIFSGGQFPVEPGSDTGGDPVNLDAGEDAADTSKGNNGVPDATPQPDVASDASSDAGGTDAATDAASDATDATDSAVCGDGFVTGDETCDPATSRGCPTNAATDCEQIDGCQPFEVVGDPSDCSSECVALAEVTVCLNGDSCCAPGCNATDDSDCASVCGNGVVEPPEVCDADCPTSCDDNQKCTVDSSVGSPQNCDFICVNDPIVDCVSGDDCCAPGCNANNDNDCEPFCGNGFVEAGEVCDGDCPSSCQDGESCTSDVMIGTPGTCDAVCTTTKILTCGPGEGCCPDACDGTNDVDCMAVCGNGVTEPGETCDGDCPVSCDDGKVCTSDGFAGTARTCDLTCTHAPIVACSNAADGCCPAGCNATNDGDCEPQCGNKVLEKGEECDGGVGDRTCLNQNLSYSGGTLGCTNTCRFDTGGCFTQASGTEHTAFVTSATFVGDEIGGIARADNLCNIAASGSTRAAGHSYVSLLADSKLGIALSDRLIWGTRVENTLGQEVVTNTTWPWDRLSNPIRYDQSGINLDPDLSPTHDEIKAWTGADAVGAPSGQDCRDSTGSPWRGTFTSPLGNSGDIGRIASTDIQWFDGGGVDACDTSSHHLYCVSARAQPNIFVFATNETFTGSQIGGVSGADQRCKLAAAAGAKTSALNRDWFAMLATAAVQPSDRSMWGDNGPNVRPVYNTNGDLVEATPANWPWNLESPVMYDEDGVALGTSRVWTGATTGGGSHANNCNGWRSSASAFFGYSAQVSATQAWLGDMSISCNTPLHLYCMSR